MFKEIPVDVDLSRIGQLYEEKLGKRQADERRRSRSNRDSDREEYNPFMPNDYEAILRDREAREEEERERALMEDYRLQANTISLEDRHREAPEMRPILDDNGPLIDKKIFKMLEKHGWEYGKGIGAQESGITAPLIPIKTSASTAIIKPLEQSNSGGVNVPNSALKTELDPVSSPGPLLQPPKQTVYTSNPVVEDPRIKPIQEKYFRK